MSGTDQPPERSPLAEVSRTDALLWLNDRLGSIVSARVELAHGASVAPLVVIGDSELRHWTDGEAPEYVAHQLDGRAAGVYRLGRRIRVDLGLLLEDSYVYRANNLHLVIDLDANVSLRISGHKAER